MEHFLEGPALLRHLKKSPLMLCFLSIETKINECIFKQRFVLSWFRWREFTAKNKLSVKKIELILKDSSILPPFCYRLL